jgi:hypothetical protein
MGTVCRRRRGQNIDDESDVAVDFMEMTKRRRLWVRVADARPGVDLAVGRYVEGDNDAEPKVARIVSIDADGNREVLVLPGTFVSNCDLLTRS